MKAGRYVQDTAIFPSATPSIASPGAMMGVVLLTENGRHSVFHQAITAASMLAVAAAAYLLMLGAGWILRVIGEAGSSIVSRVMGLILASIAAANVLEGLKEYFR
jgi:multiple antibiotic resistance protein